jgi:hypothetical protein
MALGFSIVGYPSNYKTPSAIGTQYNLLDVYIEPRATLFLATADVTITHSDGTTQTFETQRTNSITGETLSFSSNTFEIKEGENKIEYVVEISTGNSGQEYATTTSTFTIYGVTNRYPLKPWTVNDVMQRILQLVEPIRRNQQPRFTFTPPTGEKAKLFSQFAPEFTFTRQTLREALQTVGGFIHAEPRLNEDNSITFDYYGEQEYAEYTNYKTGRVKRLNEYKYRTLQSKYGIEQATTKLDSYQDNLVNRIAWEEGTTGQPYKSGIQTLRTETAYIRGTEEDTFFFPTVQGIDRIVKFEYIHEGTGYDITPYVFEENVYNNLSSYDENYPVSKSYALYFTQGGKGIKGFFYKVPSEFGGNVGKTYSIVNIIKAASGINQSANYQDMQFRLTYVPIYSTRVQQSKAYINDYLPLPRILNYTQSDNSVEARYFGENIKGSISRMGNVEKTYTLNLRNFNNIPKAGLLWDDDYYIASVSVSVNADLFEVSVGLSKNFNRKSQYIGASSYKRIYEVSETMVQQRHTVYTDYIVISDTAVNDYENTALLLQDKGFQAITSIFNAPAEGENNGIVAVHAFGQSKGNANADGDLQENVMLPVIASAFGNAMEFTWEYKDNFSAGLKNETLTQGQVTGTFGKEVEYTDYYGRLYFYYFSLLSESQAAQYTGIYPDKLPQVFVDTQFQGMAGITYPIAPMIERKDSREALRKTYTVELVTDNKDIVIGSAFAGKNPLVYNDSKRRQPHLYVLPKRVNKFATSVDLTSIEYAEDMGVVSLQYSASGKYYFSNGVPATKAGQAWVIAFEPYWELGNPVETEDGTVETPVIWYGGEIILAKNKPIFEGDTVGDFYAYAVHDVYDFIKAKN